MEKLVNIKKEDLGDEHHFMMMRFQCQCLSAFDAMDIDVNSCGKDDENKLITLRLDFYGTGFLSRLKYAWQIIRGHWNWREFVVREEDCQSLSDILDPTKKYSELP